ncbi:MAG: hypothetical protein DBY09_07730 [Selenomonadales bacterium]|nr:MAG: hypothetical protein DBY09_07730 [Selenomonadales bacterium]
MKYSFLRTSFSLLFGIFRAAEYFYYPVFSLTAAGPEARRRKIYFYGARGLSQAIRLKDAGYEFVLPPGGFRSKRY